VTTGHAGLSLIAEISDLEIADQRLRDLAPTSSSSELPLLRGP